MQLEQILDNREPEKTCRASNWYSYCWKDNDDQLILDVYHHFTQMIQFKIRNKPPYNRIPIRSVTHVDIGQGSKSDQKGMNRIFVALGLPWYYARNNKNPRILRLLKPEEVVQLPRNLRDREVRVKVFGYVA
jgi:hypothetical protein